MFCIKLSPCQCKRPICRWGRPFPAFHLSECWETPGSLLQLHPDPWAALRWAPRTAWPPRPLCRHKLMHIHMEEHPIWSSRWGSIKQCSTVKAEVWGHSPNSSHAWPAGCRDRPPPHWLHTHGPGPRRVARGGMTGLSPGWGRAAHPDLVGWAAAVLKVTAVGWNPLRAVTHCSCLCALWMSKGNL